MKVLLLLFYLSTNICLAQQEHNLDTTIYNTVEQLPRFAGCEDLDIDLLAKKACSDQKMLTYIYDRVNIPTSIDRSMLGSRVVISFIINKKGQVTSPVILKSMHPDLDSLFIQLVSAMPSWIPGRHKGKIVNVRRILPIRLCFR